jgi:integrase/recombinase XerD
VDDWVADWMIHLRASTEDSTRAVYRRGVEQFLAFLGPDITSPGQITRRHVEAWIASLAAIPRAPATIRVRTITLMQWFAWLADEPYSGVSRPLPTEGVRLATPDEKISAVPTIEAVRELLKTCEKRKPSFVDVRDAAIIRMLVDTGMRRSEMSALDLDDYDRTTGVVVIERGKGGKGRHVVVGADTTKALSRYLRGRATRPVGKQPALFIGIRGDRLQGGGIAEMLGRRAETIELQGVHPHLFRHYWASGNLAAGMPEGDIMRLAGWSSRQMLDRYSRASATERALAAGRQYSLGDKL